ncbi:cache domain-containing protein [Caballeronia sordidicola]|uniref:cache domain-containing protein n=1 Tax=Caballeronia sordidicola TaxID=196367 RepID=UPI000AB02361|nr:cache domain-containing protein [Caballeronia sordidicola]
MQLSLHGMRRKWLVLALLPFIGAMATIAVAVSLQASSLSTSEQRAIAAAYRSSKEVELKNYVALAESAVAPLYNSGRDDPETRAQVLAVLSKLEFGNDGYFFVYDLQGNLLMHPRQSELVGTNLWSMHDPNGALTIQSLLKKARNGGGFVEYLWERPSTHKLESKLGYVVTFERWGWMVGTGIYLDDVNMALLQTGRQASSNIRHTLFLIGLIGALGMGFICACGIALNVTDHRSSDAQLKIMARQVVESQEAERGRLSRELHDGISQMLVSIKLLLESALALKPSNSDRNDASGPPIQNALAQTNRTLAEIRQISHDLRPAMLDDLGLGAALRQLALEFNEMGKTPHTNIAVDAASSDAHPLPDAVNTALFRVAQEALTNIQRHAHASSARITLACAPGQVILTIVDDGIGFGYDAVQSDPRRGIGLRNMRERVESLNGTFVIQSRQGETELKAIIPVGLPSIASGRART